MSNGTNGQGEYAGLHSQMRAYDELPHAVRVALQDAPVNLGADTPRRQLFRYDATEVASNVKEMVRDFMLGGASEATKAMWTWTKSRVGKYGIQFNAAQGKDHPQADPAYPWPNYQLYPRRVKRTRVVNLRKRK